MSPIQADGDESSRDSSEGIYEFSETVTLACPRSFLARVSEGLATIYMGLNG